LDDEEWLNSLDAGTPAAGGNGIGNGAAVLLAEPPAATPRQLILPSSGRRSGNWKGRGDGNGHAAIPPTAGSRADPVDLLAVLARRPAEALRAPHLERRQLSRRLLIVARSDVALENVQGPNAAAAVFLRRYDNRRATQEAYARDLADWFVWLKQIGVEPFQATLATIESYTRQMLPAGKPAAPSTVARRLACLSHFYRRALYAGLIRRNPVEEAQRPRVSEQASTLGIGKQRAQQLIGVARATGPRETLLVLLMLELGLRISEVVGADLEDLSEQGRHQVLIIKGKGHATKDTPVPLNPAVMAAVDAVRKERRWGPLLITSTGGRLTRQQAGRLIKRLGAQIGLPDLHPHALRHAFVTLALDEGASLRDVQDAARHADPRTTRRYDRNRRNLDRHPTHRLVLALEPPASDDQPADPPKESSAMDKTHLRNAGIAAGVLAVAEGVRHRGQAPEPAGPDASNRFGFAGLRPGGFWPADAEAEIARSAVASQGLIEDEE
jgi:site-specific recombinase XerD